MSHPIAYAELHSQDPKRAGTFYGSLFGWQTKDSDTPMGTYTEIEADEGGIKAGLMKMPFGGDQSYWLPYITVASVERSVAQAEKLGAKVESPKGLVPGIGWFALLRDPAGAVFGLWEKLA
jgi:predicted enzyme related to lactoylglutathione lyase